ncbi:lysine N(6)-hydroxylase/L-ornithine N(5)-oxygenase family protein [Streptomyces profundus]|uniref:lysine N(6)-hydroxylase/L-ornithine N(5)-oxygenase family protein n=1 Tax=Streptomyces profundus TaxID=2867410 RepID=UPI001D16E15A|nr:SidA/IucD/PvdA family monooxygenase [Streptomyces sp. MA3_2.13]UED86556.1 SidA/IucD/PvdA family monooxygenase [Streptomyces sp. MA3_2.13]
MRHEKSEAQQDHYHCVGIGAGPANLSLASLLHPVPSLSNLFLDRKESFSWHDGQQIPGSSLQVSLFKDLVTLADPTNPFSFLAYLHDQGRIHHFINASFASVAREEFRDYLDWACRHNENVVFGENVREIDFDGVFRIRTDRRTVTGDNLVVGVGNRPWVPEYAVPHLGATNFHVSEFLQHTPGTGGKRVVVVGGGQSGAEAFEYLVARQGADQPRRVSWISRRRNFFPIDDSPFTNDFFMPCHSEYFYALPPRAREAFNRRYVLSSDGISESTLRSVYQSLYTRRFVDGLDDLVGLYPNRETTGLSPGVDGSWVVTTRHCDRPAAQERFEADVVVWATGFAPAPLDFLGPLADRLEWEGNEPRVDADFAARWDGPPGHDIFFQNAVRGQRGLADVNLSLNAWRSRRIVDRLRGRRGDEQLPSFIEWSAKASAPNP